MDNVLKVASQSNPNSIAGMILALIKEGSTRIALMTIGAGAVNQGIKSIAIARGYAAPMGYNLVCIPGFYKVTFDGNERTGIKLIVEVQ